MSLFHRHRWQEQSRTFTPPRNVQADRMSESLFERLICGFTTVEMRCPGCGRFDHVITPGRIPGDTR